MKSIAEVAARKEDSLAVATAIEGGEFFLGGDRLHAEERMGVGDFAVDAGRVDLVLAIDGDEVLRIGSESLEAVHPVHGLREHRPVGMARHAVVPGRPRKPGLGHDTPVAVHRGEVRLVPKGSEQATFVGISIGEQAQRFIGMGC